MLEKTKNDMLVGYNNFVPAMAKTFPLIMSVIHFYRFACQLQLHMMEATAFSFALTPTRTPREKKTVTKK